MYSFEPEGQTLKNTTRATHSFSQRDYFDEKSTQGWWVLRSATATDHKTLVRAFINILGAILFAVGSLGWVVGFPVIGTFIFAGSNIFCYCVTGTWWAVAARQTFKNRYEREALLMRQVSTGEESIRRMHPGLMESPASALPQLDTPDVVKAFRILTHLEMMAAAWQVIGALAFTVGCFTDYFIGPPFYTETVLFWLAGSFFFLLQAIISQIICESVLGPMLPLWPTWPSMNGQAQINLPYSCCMKHRICVHKCVPGALLNFLGSLIFSAASVCLWYETTDWLGGWGYLLGSCMFVIAAYADINGFLDALALRSRMMLGTRC